MSLTLTLETITPLFLGGAEPRGTPELRAPSFRGAMRYWYRAALGGVVGDGAIKKLQDAEAQVFGDTTRGSEMVIRVSQPNLETAPYEKQKGKQYNKQGKPQAAGVDYLFWAMAGFSNMPSKQMIRSKSSFELTLAERRGRAGMNNEERAKFDDASFQAEAALWLLLNLGGLGSRSRRGAGSFGVTSISGTTSLPFEAASNLEALQKNLANGLQMIRERFAEIHDQKSLTDFTQHPAFDVLAPKVSHVWVVRGNTKWTSAEQALENIGAAMRDFRSYTIPDHDTVRDLIDGRLKQDPTIERAIFGLPLPFRYSNNGPQDVVQGRREEYERRASPLSLRVSRAGNEYVGVAVLFESQFLPKGETLHLARSKKTARVPGTYELIHRFIADKFNATEVEFK